MNFAEQLIAARDEAQKIKYRGDDNLAKAEENLSHWISGVCRVDIKTMGGKFSGVAIKGAMSQETEISADGIEPLARLLLSLVQEKE